MLKSCWKRAERFGRPGEIDLDHPLAVAWMNCEWFMVHGSDTEGEEELADLIALDWFAHKVDAYARDNLIENDETLGALLLLWRSRMFFDPLKLH